MDWVQFLKWNVNRESLIEFELTFVTSEDTFQAFNIHLFEATEQILQLVLVVSNILSIESEKGCVQVGLSLHWMITVL